MANIREELKERFWLAELFILEKSELFGLDIDGEVIPDDWTDKEKTLMKTFRMLQDTVDAISADKVEQTTQLRDKRPDIFERTFVAVTTSVGAGFYPAAANEFVDVLNMNLERMAKFAAISNEAGTSAHGR
jgi:hypothetical protein